MKFYVKKDGYLNVGPTDTNGPYVWKQLIFSEEHIKQIQSRSQCLGKLYIPFCMELYTFHEMNMKKIHIYTGLVFTLPTLKKMKTCTSDIFAYQALQLAGKNTVIIEKDLSLLAHQCFPEETNFS